MDQPLTLGVVATSRKPDERRQAIHPAHLERIDADLRADDSATWENSEALLEYLPIVMAGPAAWDADETIRRAIEIREGIVENPRILSFQGRESTYPYAVSAP